VKKGIKTVVLYFVLIVIIPVMVVVLVDGGLRLLDYGYQTDFYLEKTHDGEEVLVDNYKFSWRFFPAGFFRQAQPFIIPKVKQKASYRIVVLGASAAMGDPEPAYSFSRILEYMLRERYPDKKFEIVNAGMTAINSNVVLPIAKDCNTINPDLYIVYLGNNEVIGPYGPGTFTNNLFSGYPFIRSSILLSDTKIGQWISNLDQSDSTTLEEWGGMKMFLGQKVHIQDEEVLEKVYSHYRKNLEAICDLARKDDAGVILSTVVSNLKDTPPFYAEHVSGISGEYLELWNEHYEKGIAQEEQKSYPQAIRSYEKALAIDSLHADLHFRLGTCRYQIGEFKKALHHFVKARDYDAIRFRADSELNKIVKDVAAKLSEQSVYLVDAVSALHNQCKGNIPDNSILLEHVHFNFKGNYLLAKALMPAVEQHFDFPSSSGVIPTRMQCQEALGYTVFEQEKIVKHILGVISQPPFTNQLYHQQTINYYRDSLTILRDAMAPSGQIEKAIAIYQKAVVGWQKDWTVINKFGRFLDDYTTQQQRAAEMFEKALDIHPFNSGLMNNLGIVLTKLGDHQRAERYILKALECGPKKPSIYQNLAFVYQQQNDFAQARTYYEKARLSSDEIADKFFDAGMSALASGDKEKAEAIFEKARNISNTAKVNYGLGMARLQENELDKASEYLVQALRTPDALDSNMIWDSRVSLARINSRNRQFDTAVQYYQNALQYDISKGRVHQELSIAMTYAGQYDAALQHLDSANAHRAIEDFNALKAMIWNEKAAHQSSSGDVQGAVYSYQQALKFDPGSEVARQNLEILKLMHDL